MGKDNQIPSDTESNVHGAFQSEANIHPTAVLGPHVTVAPDVSIGPFSVITGTVSIASGTTIHSHVSIGAAAQDTNTSKPIGSIFIGKNCTIREFASIHSPKEINGITQLDDNCYVMTYCHVAHDSYVGKNVVLTSGVSIGGHAHIEHHAFLMAHASLHQRCRVGAYTAISPYSGSRQDLPPFCLFDGKPGKFAGLNKIALIRAGLSQASQSALKHATHLFYLEKMSLESIIALADKEPDWGNDTYVQQFLTFIQESERGVSRKTIRSK